MRKCERCGASVQFPMTKFGRALCSPCLDEYYVELAKFFEVFMKGGRP